MVSRFRLGVQYERGMGLMVVPHKNPIQNYPARDPKQSGGGVKG